MDRRRLALGLILVLAVAVASMSSLRPDDPRRWPVLVDERPVEAADLSGPPPQSVVAQWRGQPVLILKLERHLLADPEASVAVRDEPGHRIVGYAAKSPFRGCELFLRTDGPAAALDRDMDGRFDGLLVDGCYPQFAWDPHEGGRLRIGIYHEPPDCLHPYPSSEAMCLSTLDAVGELQRLDLRDDAGLLRATDR